ncbi:hypothetical protein L1987_84272 [Smallanthus sonchifolius]|uniref:Uncharacterized protein n=1 Tax=Smallanthus sonchifolius TaxID=185202 RepID=A0ACB8YE57_9ASTR|nr:hypothetical protein L1987_84272 [Smallanthus sonchifolius]
MILRSSKALIKRPKSTNLDEDFIGKLHDALLIQILSLLPESDANRTRILSNRWKNLWAFLPNLHFVMPFCWSIEEINKFHDSVDQTLALRDGMPVQRFYLYCSKNCNYDRVYDWLCKVVKCRVEEIELRFPADRFTVRFCWDLFRACSSLVSLTLRGEFLLHVPDDELLFPCLKKIELVSIVYSGDESFANLISGCPVLEELFVERQLIGQFDNMERFLVVSPSLKRLRLSFALCVIGVYKVVIDAPKLEYLNILDVMSTDYSLTKPLSLTEAHIRTLTDGQVESVGQLMTCLSSVKILTLTDSTLMALSYVYGLNMPMFPNLVKFVVGIDVVWGWNILPTLLDNMPNLEHITFADGLLPFPRAQHIFNMRWSPPVEVPACLPFKMKEIIIENRETISPEEFNLIRYLLRHSNNLESLTINAHKIDARRREQMSKFYRASKSCRIEFI